MKLVPLSEKYSRTMTSASGEIVSEVRVINTKKINAARQKRLQIRRMKCTYQTTTRFQRKNEEKNNSDEATEMSFSLSYSSSSSSSSENLSENGVVLGEFVAKEESRLGERLSRVGSHGLMSVIGRRRDMEDALRVEIGFLDRGGEKYDFFGVYDGHGGPWVAEACKERLHKVLVETISENQDDNNGIAWERVMEDCFEKVDEEVNRRSLKEEMVGSTAVVAVVGKEEVVVANCGDSRAVLSRGGDVVPMSIDHKPERADELERIEGAGGRVINWNGHRVLGVLATSRSIGDQCLKPFVISKPEVTVTKRTNSDEFLILASDGLWDVVSNDVACQVVRRCFNGRLKWTSKSLDVATNKNRATTAAAVLTELAMTRGSSDNISVVVVDLRKPRSLIC